MNRRSFLKQTGAATVASGLTGATQGVSIIVDPQDPIASAGPPAWAVRELQAALEKQGVAAKVYPRFTAAPARDLHIVVAGGIHATEWEILRPPHVILPTSPEALCLIPGSLSGRAG